ncbi:hypothetical protein EJB05_06229 [Eragrostis curvula]|uniref:Uncharacterized protein n=1 Tax=Eragrostis curvula TaxID=38414 RepID=A0A5J9WEF7_9POAL|nr:hypothetical protein EJB05_06229 [Eragrostis curvula]
MKRPVIPIQAAKFAAEGGMVLRQHILVLPNWKEYKKDPSYYMCGYIVKVVGNFCIDTTNKTVKDACVDMLKSDTSQLRYRLKKKYFDGVPTNKVTTTSPVSSMTDEQWGTTGENVVKPKAQGMPGLQTTSFKMCLVNKHSCEKIKFNHRTSRLQVLHCTSPCLER